MTKYQINRIHTKRRMRERYGLELGRNKHQEICDLIAHSNGRYLSKRVSNTRSIYIVPFEGQEIRVVYDRKRKCLVTALPNTPGVVDAQRRYLPSETGSGDIKEMCIA